MRNVVTLAAAAALAVALGASGAAQERQALSFATSAGPLVIAPLGHASLLIRFGDQVIHVDPYSQVADYAAQPKATQVWITHEHGDHLDPKALDAVSTPTSRTVADARSAAKLQGRPNVTILANGQGTDLPGGIRLEAVPAYNITQERQPGVKYHPRGDYNGYVATFGNVRVYVAGDSECVPEVGRLGAIDVAFLPINLPFTMTPEEAAACAKVIGPKVLVPYHQGEADPNRVSDLLRNSGIDVRVFKLP